MRSTPACSPRDVAPRRARPGSSRITFGPDTGASAARFWLPRLDSEESLAAADAAGLDREQVRGSASSSGGGGPGGVDEPVLGLDEVEALPPTPSEVAAAEEIRALGG